MANLSKRAGEQAREDAVELSHGARGGGWLATVISAFALVFSGYSFYESVLRASEMAIYVPPRIAYTDPDRPESPFEVFIVPVTLANDGARTGTVLSIDLEVTNAKTGQSKKFYSAQVGPWGVEPAVAFAPVSLAGRTSATQAIQFFPRADETLPRITDFEGGTYRFKLSLNIAAAAQHGLFAGKAVPLSFEMRMGKMDYRMFNGTGTLPLWSADYRPAATPGNGG